MQSLTEFAKSLADLPPSALSTFIILSGFGLAAYAIWAVVAVSRSKDRSQ